MDRSGLVPVAPHSVSAVPSGAYDAYLDYQYGATGKLYSPCAIPCKESEVNKMRNIMLAIAAVACMSPIAARADPIGPTCANNSCFGGIYQLVSQQLSATHYIFGIVMDLSNNTLPVGTTIENVAFKVTNGNPSSLSAFLIGTNALGNWLVTDIGGLSNNGCDTGPAAFICTSHVGGTPQLADTNTLLGFVYDVTVSNPLDWQLLSASLKIDFSGNGHLLSEPIMAQPGIPVINPNCIPVESCGTVPEPGSLALVGIGLAGLMGIGRRKPKAEKLAA